MAGRKQDRTKYFLLAIPEQIVDRVFHRLSNYLEKETNLILIRVEKKRGRLARVKFSHLHRLLKKKKLSI